VVCNSLYNAREFVGVTACTGAAKTHRFLRCFRVPLEVVLLFSVKLPICRCFERFFAETGVFLLLGMAFAVILPSRLARITAAAVAMTIFHTAPSLNRDSCGCWVHNVSLPGGPITCFVCGNVDVVVVPISVAARVKNRRIDEVNLTVRQRYGGPEAPPYDA